jgi:hypothetical protein
LGRFDGYHKVCNVIFVFALSVRGVPDLDIPGPDANLLCVPRAVTGDYIWHTTLTAIAINDLPVSGFPPTGRNSLIYLAAHFHLKVGP